MIILKISFSINAFTIAELELAVSTSFFTVIGFYRMRLIENTLKRLPFVC
jgi:hypothetical protein